MTSYNPAPYVEKTLTVTKAPQTITFGALTNASLYTGTYSLDGKASSASSNLTVAYATSNSAVASLSGTTLTLHSGGTVTITASQEEMAPILPPAMPPSRSPSLMIPRHSKPSPGRRPQR